MGAFLRLFLNYYEGEPELEVDRSGVECTLLSQKNWSIHVTEKEQSQEKLRVDAKKLMFGNHILVFIKQCQDLGVPPKVFFDQVASQSTDIEKTIRAIPIVALAMWLEDGSEKNLNRLLESIGISNVEELGKMVTAAPKSREDIQSKLI